MYETIITHLMSEETFCRVEVQYNILCSFIVMILLDLRKGFALAPYTLQFVHL